MSRSVHPGPVPIEDSDEEHTLNTRPSDEVGERWPHLVHMTGQTIGSSQRLESIGTILGRSSTAHLRIDDLGVSRLHARIWRDPTRGFVIEDLGSANGTLVNGRRLEGAVELHEGDKIQIGANTILRYTFFDAIDERYHRLVGDRMSITGESQVTRVGMQTLSRGPDWSLESWKQRPVAQEVRYDDPDQLKRVIEKLRSLPPLVTSWEVDDLKRQLAEAQQGRRFLLQGGDCAEMFGECTARTITNKLKILIQMSLVLIRGARRPVIRVGRFAGQYAKPRSKMTETRDGVELTNYLGDLVNRPEFSADARRPDPELLLSSYFHSAVTLNFVRSLSAVGFADLRRPEYFDLSYFERADLPPSLKLDYKRLCREVTEGLQFLRAVGDSKLDELMKINWFTSHEGLNLIYESAQTRPVPWAAGFYDLTTHLPWIGERTRLLDGAHVEFFRGVRNPIGVKLGPKADPREVVEMTRVLNPENEAGKVVLITRMGAGNVARALPNLIDYIRTERRQVLWVCDPMHGNGTVTSTGVKTRDFNDILSEITTTMEVHDACESIFGGVHFELTGDDVTECVGGGVEEADLTKNYATACDPRLNYRQALQMAFSVSEGLSKKKAISIPPPSHDR